MLTCHCDNPVLLLQMVALELYSTFNCFPVFLGPSLKERYYKGMQQSISSCSWMRVLDPQCMHWGLVFTHSLAYPEALQKSHILCRPCDMLLSSGLPTCPRASMGNHTSSQLPGCWSLLISVFPSVSSSYDTLIPTPRKVSDIQTVC